MIKIIDKSGMKRIFEDLDLRNVKIKGGFLTIEFEQLYNSVAITMNLNDVICVSDENYCINFSKLNEEDNEQENK